MRIVHVSVGALPPVFGTQGGAIQRWVAELAREQQRRGHDVTVYSPGSTPGRAVVDGVEVHYVRLTGSGGPAHLQYQLRVASSLRRNQPPDVTHVHSEPEAAVLTPGVGGAKVLSYNNYFFRRGKSSPLFPLYTWALRHFDLLLPCSEYCRDESVAYWRLPRERVHIGYSGVNLNTFRPDRDAGLRARDQFGIPPSPTRVILYVGRVCRQKGSDTLLEAYRRLRARRDDVALVVVGPIEQFAGGASAASAWPEEIAESGGRYLGPVQDEALPALMNAADVFVMPTRELEMFGMAAVEAQACGLPVVASDHGGLRETVPPEAGLRFAPGDPADLAARIEELLADPERQQRFRAGARANAERYGWSRIADALEEPYSSALARRRPRAA